MLSKKVPATAMKKLFGLGWHLPSIGSWIMYMLSCIDFSPMLIREVPRPLASASLSQDVSAKRTRLAVGTDALADSPASPPNDMASTSSCSPNAKMERPMMDELLVFEISDEGEDADAKSI